MKKLLIVCICAWCAIGSPLQAQWSNITPDTAINLFSLSVLDNQTAVLMTSDSLCGLCKTEDGGASWQPLTMPVWSNPDPAYINGTQFVDEQTGFAYGSWLVGGGVFAGGTENFILYKTSDGGQSWTYLPQPVPLEGFANISMIHFFNAQQGVVTLVTGLSYSLVKTTDDGGVSWQTRDTLEYWDHAEYFNPDGTGAAILFEYHTSQYFLYQIADFGKIWTKVGTPGVGAAWNALKKGLWFDGALFLNDTLSFRIRTDEQGFGIDDNIHYLDKSTDGGLTWQENYFNSVGYTFQKLALEQPNPWIMTWANLFRYSTTGTNTAEVLKRAPLMQVYPNPVTAGTMLALQTKEPFTGSSEVIIYTFDGKRVQRSSVEVNQGTATLKTPALPAGTYQIQLYGAQKMLGTGKLIIK